MSRIPKKDLPVGSPDEEIRDPRFRDEPMIEFDDDDAFMRFVRAISDFTPKWDYHRGKRIPYLRRVK